MKHGKKLLCLALSGVLALSLLAGCGGQDTQPEETAPAADDIAYEVAGISRDTVLFTVDGAEVTADEYLFWLLSIITQVKQGGELATDEAWAGEIEGVPAVEYVKSHALETAKLYTLMETRAAAAGVTLSEADLADADAQMNQVISYLSMSGYTLQEYLDAQCITEETFNKFNQMYYLNNNYLKKLVADGDERIVPTDEELTAFLDENGFYSCKHILLETRRATGETNAYGMPVYEDFSEEETAAVKAKADGLVAQIRAAADPAAKFDELMHAYSEDGRNADGTLAAPEGYDAYSGQMVEEFETTAKALAVGEVSEPVKSIFGYHIILRLPQNTKNETNLGYYYSNAMNDLVEGWMDEAVVETTEAYAALDPKSFYDKLTERNDAWAAEKQAQATSSAQPEDVTGDPADENAVG